MNRMRFLALLLAVTAIAQTPTPAPAPTKLTLPDWFGGGAEFGPHWGSWAALALPMSQSQAIYSYSLYEALLVKGKVPTISTTTGLATILRQYSTKKGTLYLLGLATAGAAVTATATTASFSGGGIGVWKFSNGFTLEIGATAEKAGAGTTYNYKAGWGRTFGQ